MNLPSDTLAAFAPTGVLRASINLGNPILAHAIAAMDAPGGVAGAASHGAGGGAADTAIHGASSAVDSAGGVSVDLAAALAAKLGVGLELQVFKTAAQSVEAVTLEQADIGFFAIDPVRGAGIGFTAPYVLIEGCYLVRNDSPLHDNADVDRVGTRVVVGAGSAYDLHLTRTLRHARIVQAPSSPAVMDTFVSQGLEVAAGVKQQLELDALRLGGHRLLPGHFMVIQQAMGLPKGRGEAAQQFLTAFVEEMKASGFVAAALARHRVQGASVAPAA